MKNTPTSLSTIIRSQRNWWCHQGIVYAGMTWIINFWYNIMFCKSRSEEDDLDHYSARESRIHFSVSNACLSHSLFFPPSIRTEAATSMSHHHSLLHLTSGFTLLFQIVIGYEKLCGRNILIICQCDLRAHNCTPLEFGLLPSPAVYPLGWAKSPLTFFTYIMYNI